MRILDHRGQPRQLQPLNVFQELLQTVFIGPPVPNRPGALVQRLSPEKRQALQHLRAEDLQVRVPRGLL